MSADEAWDALRASEARLSLGVQVGALAIAEVRYDTDTFILTRAAALLYGVGLNDISVPRQRIHDTFHPEEREELEQIIAATLDPAGPGWFVKEHRIVWPNGEVRWLNVRKQVYFDRTVTPARRTHAILAAQDITERKRSEEQLRLFAAVAYNTQDAVMITDAQVQGPSGPRIEYVNESFLLMSGYETHEVLGQTPRMLQGVKTDRASLAALHASLDAQRPARVEVVNYRKDGTPFDVAFEVVPVKNAQGTVTHWVSVQRDVTVRKREESATRFLLALETELKSVLEASAIESLMLARLGDYLEVGGASLGRIEGDRAAVMEREWHAAGHKHSLAGRHSLTAYFSAHIVDELREGRSIAIDDVATVDDTQAHVDRSQALDIAALLVAPVLTRGSFAAYLTVTNATPRRWRADELQLVQEVIARTWPVIERTRAQERLVLSEQRFRLAMEAAAMYAWDLDVREQRLFYSPNAATVLRRDPPERLADFWMLVHSEDAEPTRARFSHALAHDHDFQIEHRMSVQPDESELWLLTVGMVTRNAEGLATHVVAISQDISTRKRAEQRLRESEERFRLAAQTAMFGVHDYDVRNDKSVWTSELYALTGLQTSSAPLRLQDVVKVTHPEDRERVAAAMGTAMDPNGGGEFAEEFRIVRADTGETRWILNRSKTLFEQTPSGRVAVRNTGIVIDVTERKRMEHAWRESEAQYRTLFDSIDEGLSIVEVILDATGQPSDYRFLEVNPIFAKHTGLHDAVGRTALEIIPSLERFWIDAYGKVALTGEPMRFSQGSDTMGRWFDVYAARIGGATSRKVVILFNDITEQKRTERALVESERLARVRAQDLDAVVKSIPAALWFAHDASGSVITGNAEAARLLGTTPEGNVSALLADAARPRNVQETRNGQPIPAEALPLQMAARSGAEVRGAELTLHLANGDERVILGNAAPLRDADGKTRGAVGAFVDITSLKRAEQALKDADLRKNEFLAMLAHELRNPLAPISNAVHILKTLGPAEPKLQKARDIIERQVRHIVRLVDDLLDVSRVTQGKVNLRKEGVALAVLVESAIELVRHGAEEKQHHIAVNLPTQPVFLHVDPVRITQAIGNILSNSIKYTPIGGNITIRAQCDATDACLMVRDDGMGIAPELLPHVFELFTQAERSLDRSQGGLGIGLALVKRLVELHGGDVEAHSRGAGQGSEFVMRLPLGDSAQVQEPDSVPLAAPNHQSDKQRILVVDDNVDAAETLATLLRLEGHEVFVAHDAAAALDVSSAQRPTLALLDIGLPDVDGYRVAQMLRARGIHARMVALSGYEPDAERVKQSGFVGYLIKPVDPDVLVKFIGVTS